MKVLFLDIDGVVCLHDREKGINFSDGGADDRFDAECCKRLKRIIDATGCKIVLSSAWREKRCDIENMLSQLLPFGITLNDFIGRTPSLFGRDEEVSAYLKAHPEIDSFIAVDDENFCSSKFPRDRLVLTDERSGITDRIMNICIELLS